jgi:hypothetical protein
MHGSNEYRGGPHGLFVREATDGHARLCRWPRKCLNQRLIAKLALYSVYGLPRGLRIELRLELQDVGRTQIAGKIDVERYWLWVLSVYWTLVL